MIAIEFEWAHEALRVKGILDVLHYNSELAMHPDRLTSTELRVYGKTFDHTYYSDPTIFERDLSFIIAGCQSQFLKGFARMPN